MELMCDKVAVINKGKIVKTEEIGEKQEKHEEEQTIISVDNNKKAEKILKEKKYEVSRLEGKISVKSNYEKVPEIIKLLVNENISIYNVVQKEKSLEDIFFQATEKKEKGDEKNA